MRYLIFIIVILSLTACKKNYKYYKVSLTQGSTLQGLSKDSVNFKAHLFNPTYIGRGYNTATQDIRGFDVVESLDTSSDPISGQLSHSFTIEQISTVSQLYESMNASAGASLGIGVFSLGGSAKFLKEKTVNSTNNFLLVRVKIVDHKKQIKRPYLSKGAKAKLAQGMNAFLDFAGDEFVSEEIYGGELNIIFIASSSSKTERKQNSQKLDVAVKAFRVGGDRSAGFTSLDSIRDVKAVIYRVGDDGTPIADTLTAEELLDYALEFSDRIRQHPVLIGYTTEQYSKLADFDSAQSVDYRNILIQKQFFEDVAIQAWDILGLNTELSYVVNNPSYFIKGLSDSARVINNSLAGQVLKLQRCVRNCQFQFNPKNCDINNCPEMSKKIPLFESVLID